MFLCLNFIWDTPQNVCARETCWAVDERLWLYVSAVCPAPLPLIGPLYAAFQTTEHAESVAEPIGERDHSDWFSESVQLELNRNDPSEIFQLPHLSSTVFSFLLPHPPQPPTPCT